MDGVPTGAAPENYYLGTFVLYVEGGPPSTSIGYLKVIYDIELSVPRPNQILTALNYV